MLSTLTTPSPRHPVLTSGLSHQDLATKALAWAESGLTVRAVRGAKSGTVPDLFNEFAAALQFPYYFGDNWASFDECLADLDWLPLAAGVVIVIYDADQLLKSATSADESTFFKVVSRAANELSAPVEDGEWWDRPGAALHLVLQLQDEGTWPWTAGQDLLMST